MTAIPPLTVKDKKQANASLLWTDSTSAMSNSRACSMQPSDLQYDSTRYIVENIKKYSNYTNKDLPILNDHCRSHKVIGILTLWCGSHSNIWVIPNESFAAALQEIFSAIYPRIKYCTTTNVTDVWDLPLFSPIPSSPLSHSLWDMITNNKGISLEIWDQFVGGNVPSITF